MSTLISIYTCVEAGEAMTEWDKILAIAGVGLEGDRYATGKGAYPNNKIRHVSLISLEALQSILPSFEMHETRRNLLTFGVDLNSLVDKFFLVGNVRMRGTELCHPCVRPSKLAHKKGFEEALQGLGGIRAEILTTGELSVGNLITVL